MRNCGKSDKNCRDAEGNCFEPGTDNLAVQCVGPWVEDKYFFLEKYLNATREVRRKYSDNNNAVFIDLFSGPGRCIIRNEKREIDSGGLLSLMRKEASFNEYHYIDKSGINIASFRKRANNQKGCHFHLGDSNDIVKSLVKELLKKSYRYHFAYIDPFGPENLHFTTLTKLAELRRMDMLIHFPIGPIKRNLHSWMDKSNTILDKFLGTDTWRIQLKKEQKQIHSNVSQIMLDIFKGRLISIGYPREGLFAASSDKSTYPGLPIVPVKNTKKVSLYVLILAAKHQRAQKIWQSIIRTDRQGQGSLF